MGGNGTSVDGNRSGMGGVGAFAVSDGMDCSGRDGDYGGNRGWRGRLRVGWRGCEERALVDIAVRIRVLDSGMYGGSHAGDGGAAPRYVKHGFAAI